MNESAEVSGFLLIRETRPGLFIVKHQPCGEIKSFLIDHLRDGRAFCCSAQPHI